MFKQRISEERETRREGQVWYARIRDKSVYKRNNEQKKAVGFRGALILFLALFSVNVQADIFRSMADAIKDVTDPVRAASITEVSGQSAQSLVASFEDNQARCGSATSKADLVDGFKIFSYSVSGSLAVGLNIWTNSGNVSKTDRVHVYDLVWYKGCRDSEGDLYGRYISGVQLKLKSSGLEASASSGGLSFLAANAELNQARVRFELQTTGISGPGVDAAMPPSTDGTYDVQTHVELFQAIDRLREAVQANNGKVYFTPVFTSELPQFNDTELLFLEGLGHTQGLMCVRDGISYNMCRKQNPSVSKNQLKRTYKFFMEKFKKSSNPDEIEQRQALKVLTRMNLGDLKTG